MRLSVFLTAQWFLAAYVSAVFSTKEMVPARTYTNQDFETCANIMFMLSKPFRLYEILRAAYW
jgi:hypothetical protein